MRSAVIFLMLLALSGCKDKKKPAPEAVDTAECESNDDCGEGEACLDGECAGTSQKTRMTAPSNAVTPDKVKREVEKINEASEARTDKSLDL